MPSYNFRRSGLCRTWVERDTDQQQSDGRLALTNLQPIRPGSSSLAKGPWHVAEQSGAWSPAEVEWVLAEHCALRRRHPAGWGIYTCKKPS